MQFQVLLTASAEVDLDYFKAFEQRTIVDAIRVHLTSDANIESKRRKRLKNNSLAPWELRVGKYRLFYSIEETTVNIVAIGYKEHNDLFIQGQKVEL